LTKQKAKSPCKPWITKNRSHKLNIKLVCDFNNVMWLNVKCHCKNIGFQIKMMNRSYMGFNTFKGHGRVMISICMYIVWLCFSFVCNVFQVLKYDEISIFYNHCSITKLGKKKTCQNFDNFVQLMWTYMTLSIYEQAKKTHKKFRMYKETTLLKGRKKNKSQTMKHPRKLLPKIIRCFLKN
jgi:hypothetical protein